MNKKIFILLILTAGVYLGYVYRTDINFKNKVNSFVDKQKSITPSEIDENPNTNIIIKDGKVEVVKQPVFNNPNLKSLLPVNQFVLIKYKSLETNTGIKGFAPGIILTKQGNYFITKEGDKLELKTEEYTGDLEIAKKYVQADKMAQLKAKYVPPEITPAPTSTPQINNNNNNITDNRPAATPNSTPFPNRLNNGPYDNSADKIKVDENGKKYILLRGKRYYLN
jgi:hypothetical protein